MSDPQYWARVAVAAMNRFTDSMAGSIIPHDEEHHFDELMSDVSRWIGVLRNRTIEFDYSNGVVVESDTEHETDDDDDNDDDVVYLATLVPPNLRRQTAMPVVVVVDSDSDDDDTMIE